MENQSKVIIPPETSFSMTEIWQNHVHQCTEYIILYADYIDQYTD